MVKLEILTQIKEEFKGAINPDIISLKMVQNDKEVYLEKIYRDRENIPVKESLSKFTQPIYQKIDDLKFERAGEIAQFLPETDIEENAWILLNEYDRQSMVMLFDDIFTEEGALEILINLD